MSSIDDIMHLNETTVQVCELFERKVSVSAALGGDINFTLDAGAAKATAQLLRTYIGLSIQLTGIVDRQDARIADQDKQLRECVALVRDITKLPLWKFALFRLRTWHKQKKPAHPKG